MLDQFAALEEQADAASSRAERQLALDAVVQRSEPLSVGVVASEGVGLPKTSVLQQSLAGLHPLSLCVGQPLPSVSDDWVWPTALQEQDALLFVLPLPLRASDLLRLQQVPERQPAWLVVNQGECIDAWPQAQEALLAQLPERWHQHLLLSLIHI